MSKNTKIILIVVGVIALAVILCCGGFMAIGFSGAKGQKAAMEAGEQFGSSATEQDCQEAAWKRAADCTQFQFTCPMEVQGFFNGCLTQATETPGFCEGFPPVGDDAFSYGVEIGQFAAKTCQELGTSRFRPRDPDIRPLQQVCTQVIQTRAIQCTARQR